MASAGAIRAGQAFVELLADDSKLQTTLKQAQARVKLFASQAMSAGASLLRAGGAIAAPLAIATKMFADFGDRMAVVRAVSGATEEQFKSLTEQAKQLGSTTSFTAAQVAEGMTALGRAGFDPTEISAAIPQVLALARATDTELGEAADIAGAALRGFGMETAESGRVADVLAAAANGSAQTLVDLGESLKYVAPQARQVGADVEETAAALGILANNGIKGSMAGTALLRAYKNLATTNVQNKLREIGVAAVDANGDMRSVAQIISEIGEATKNMGSGTRTNIFSEIFGRGSTAAQALAASSSQLENFEERLRNVNGEAERLSKQMDDTLGGSFRILMSSVEGVAIAIGEALQGDLREWVAWMTDAAGSIKNFVENNKNVVLWVGKAAAVLLAAGGTLTGLGLAANMVAFSMGGLSAVMSYLRVATNATIYSMGSLSKFMAYVRAAASGTSASLGGLGMSMDAVRVKADALRNSSLGASRAAGMVGVTMAAFAGIQIGVMIGEWAAGIDGLVDGLRATNDELKEMVSYIKQSAQEWKNASATDVRRDARSKFEAMGGQGASDFYDTKIGNEQKIVEDLRSRLSRLRNAADEANGSWTATMGDILGDRVSDGLREQMQAHRDGWKLGEEKLLAEIDRMQEMIKFDQRAQKILTTTDFANNTPEQLAAKEQDASMMARRLGFADLDKYREKRGIGADISVTELTQRLAEELAKQRGATESASAILALEGRLAQLQGALDIVKARASSGAIGEGEGIQAEMDLGKSIYDTQREILQRQIAAIQAEESSAQAKFDSGGAWNESASRERQRRLQQANASLDKLDAAYQAETIALKDAMGNVGRGGDTWRDQMRRDLSTSITRDETALQEMQAVDPQNRDYAAEEEIIRRIGEMRLKMLENEEAMIRENTDLSDRERKDRLAQIQEQAIRARSATRLAILGNQAEEAREATKTEIRRNVSGSFRGLDQQAFASGKDAQERTAKATEAMRSDMRESKRSLKKIEKQRPQFTP